jgi:Protein of unknown function (DUF3572)
MSLSTRQKDNTETIALMGLQFLAADGESLAAFLQQSGLEAGEIRAAAAQPDFLGAVLTFLCEDEERLFAFANSINSSPEAVDKARIKLAGQWERDTP